MGDWKREAKEEADLVSALRAVVAERDTQIAALKAALGALCDTDDAFTAHTSGCQMSPCRTCNEHAESQEYAFIDAKEVLSVAAVSSPGATEAGET